MSQNVQKLYKTMFHTSLSIQISNNHFQCTLHSTSLPKHVYRAARAKKTDTGGVSDIKKASMIKADLMANFFSNITSAVPMLHRHKTNDLHQSINFNA